MRVASLFLALLLVVTILGACLPQLPADARKSPAWSSTWLAQAEERWGRAAVLLHRWGLFELFRSPAYVGLVTLVVLSTLSCTLSRWPAAWRRAFHRPAGPPDVSVGGAREVVTLPPVPLTTLRAALEALGYRVQAWEVGATVRVRADRRRLSELGTLGTHLAVLLLILGFVLTGLLGWQETVELAPGRAAPVGHGTGLSVRSDGWTVDHYPDGSVAAYRTHVAVLEETGVVAQGTIEVNRPLRLRGLGIYLSGFRESEAGITLDLRVTRDPGKDLALAGGILLFVGTSVAIYLPHCRILARLDPERTQLALPRDGVRADLKLLAEELGSC
jgi:cytochrome c biogenesis protein ResB